LFSAGISRRGNFRASKNKIIKNKNSIQITRSGKMKKVLISALMFFVAVVIIFRSWIIPSALKNIASLAALQVVTGPIAPSNFDLLIISTLFSAGITILVFCLGGIFHCFTKPSASSYVKK
jgi:hypothetical protein